MDAQNERLYLYLYIVYLKFSVINFIKMMSHGLLSTNPLDFDKVNLRDYISRSRLKQTFQQILLHIGSGLLIRVDDRDLLFVICSQTYKWF